MESDFMARGYLLPAGCKDLIDVLNLKHNYRDVISVPKFTPQVWKLKSKPQSAKHSTPLPPICGEVLIPEKTTVSQLAALLGKKPFQIMADLMEIGIFASANQLLGFGTISRIARKYGFTATKKK